MILHTYMTIRPPTSPGEMLVEEFLKPLKLTQAELGERTGLGPRTINEICKGKRAITAKTAILFSDYFKMSVEFWLDLQRKTDLWKTLKEMKRLENVVKAQPSLVMKKETVKKKSTAVPKNTAKVSKSKRPTRKKSSKETQPTKNRKYA